MTLVSGYWIGVHHADPRLVALYERHYSANTATSRAARLRSGVSGVGESMCLLTLACDAAFIWLHNTTARYDGQTGVQCSFFRNESGVLASDLIREADEMAWQRWAEPRHWTYVDPAKIQRTRTPGRCFIKAGWTPCGMSKGGLLILERKLSP